MLEAKLATIQRNKTVGAVRAAILSTLLAGWAAQADAATWTKLTNQSPSDPGTMMMLSDGTIMVQNYNTFNGWMKLTPSNTGSYVAATWSNLTPMSTQRLYFASNMMQNGKIFVLGGEYAGPSLTSTWSATGEIYDPVANSWSAIANYPSQPGCPLVNNVRPPACFGDDPSILLPNNVIMAGDLLTNTPKLYNITTNSWSSAGSKVYNDQSDEEGWAKLQDGTILTYDLFKSVATNGAYAEKYNPATNTWSSISPSDGTATGTIPQLSSAAVGYELGPLLRLQDGRVFIIGATGHTALYSPATNSWAAGPDIIGSLNGFPALFGGDDSAAAILPNGHVIFTADAGPSPVTSAASITNGSNVITGISTTQTFQVGWAVSGTGIPFNASITSVDSTSQVHIDANATQTRTTTATFGGIFSNPTQVFDFDPTANTITAVSPAVGDPNLPVISAYVTRMVVLPTGQILFNDSTRQLWLYTPDGAAPPALRPTINSVTYNGAGVFTLTGKQLNGQSAGSSYGDDVESDQNFPIVRLANSTGKVFYARTYNWSTTGVATALAPESVNFKLPAGMTPGNYSLVDVGAGITSFPVFYNLSAAAAAGL
jgi:hypothetical protein